MCGADEKRALLEAFRKADAKDRITVEHTMDLMKPGDLDKKG